MRQSFPNMPLARRRTGGFTFVEILVAMLFVAVVVPVAIQGIRVANKLGIVARQKRLGALLAERKLNEMIVTKAWPGGDQKGDFGTDWTGYRWEMKVSDWSDSAYKTSSIGHFSKAVTSTTSGTKASSSASSSSSNSLLNLSSKSIEVDALSMSLVTVTVYCTIQGQEYGTSVSTLGDETDYDAAASTSASTTGALSL